MKLDLWEDLAFMFVSWCQGKVPSYAGANLFKHKYMLGTRSSGVKTITDLK